jgi:hypothetical protein
MIKRPPATSALAHFRGYTLQHHLALSCSATSISGAVRPGLGIFVTLSLLNTHAASSV